MPIFRFPKEKKKKKRRKKTKKLSVVGAAKSFKKAYDSTFQKEPKKRKTIYD